MQMQSEEKYMLYFENDYCEDENKDSALLSHR